MNKLLFTICALLAASSTFAANTFSIDKVYASKTGVSTIELNYSLDEGYPCGGFSFFIEIPEQFEFVGKNAYTPGDCYASTPTFTTNLVGNVLKISYATTDPLTKQSGTLASFQIRAKSSAVVGNTYAGGKLTEGKFVDNRTSFSESADDVDFDIDVTNRVILDENSTVLPVEQTGVDVLIKRTVKAGVWNTICLPVDLSADEVIEAFGAGTKIAKLSTFSKIDDSFKVSFATYDWQSEDGTYSSTPYLIMPTKDNNEITADAVNVYIENTTLKTSVKVSKKECAFIGILMSGLVPINNLFISNNKFYYSSTGATPIKGFRGYFYLQQFTPSSSAPEFVVDGETTSIDEINIVDGDGRIYNLNGLHVGNPTSKGVYIQNGKKVVMKK